ncbi:uncharacterized protein N7477_009304 [Penicillium maclennaniae]|uniref:uncharacterized protein n=1 Tax=Penicillium maclennaniae TaxID=1343394 RepID=UPI002540EB84|nr:uncharacterized protein N7477_009304 [Penicillium maclennaniae]KAJ5661688.1 hypothetical protein N7477_009304 [Penicillium maclennaniae]
MEPWYEALRDKFSMPTTEGRRIYNSLGYLLDGVYDRRDPDEFLQDGIVYGQEAYVPDTPTEQTTMAEFSRQVNQRKNQWFASYQRVSNSSRRGLRNRDTSRTRRPLRDTEANNSNRRQDRRDYRQPDEKLERRGYANPRDRDDRRRDDRRNRDVRANREDRRDRRDRPDQPSWNRRIEPTRRDRRDDQDIARPYRDDREETRKARAYRTEATDESYSSVMIPTPTLITNRRIFTTGT